MCTELQRRLEGLESELDEIREGGVQPDEQTRYNAVQATLRQIRERIAAQGCQPQNGSSNGQADRAAQHERAHAEAQSDATNNGRDVEQTTTQPPNARAAGGGGINIDADVERARELHAQFERANENPEQRYRLAQSLLEIYDRLEQELRRAPMDAQGRPSLTGNVQWNPNPDAPMAGRLEDIAPFGAHIIWATTPRPGSTTPQPEGRERELETFNARPRRFPVSSDFEAFERRVIEWLRSFRFFVNEDTDRPVELVQGSNLRQLHQSLAIAQGQQCEILLRARVHAGRNRYESVTFSARDTCPEVPGIEELRTDSEATDDTSTGDDVQDAEIRRFEQEQRGNVLERVIREGLRVLAGRQGVQYSRLECILRKLRNASTDDTYIPDENEAHRQANSGQYIGVSGINALTRRLRHSLTYVYEEGMSDDDLVSALEGLDRNIQRFAGFVTSQTGNEAAVPPGIRELNEWIQNRQNSSNSIYSCR